MLPCFSQDGKLTLFIYMVQSIFLCSVAVQYICMLLMKVISHHIYKQQFLPGKSTPSLNIAHLVWFMYV